MELYQSENIMNFAVGQLSKKKVEFNNLFTSGLL